MLRNLLPDARIPTPFPGQTYVIHGGDYNPEQWMGLTGISAPENTNILAEDARLMRQVGINSSSVAIFSWTPMEPREGHFDFGWLDRIMDAQADVGNKVVLATPSGAMPAWMAEKYPEIRRVDRQGRRAIYGARHNHCWSSPVYHEKVAIINDLLARRYKTHPALAMWHVSNELNGECFCTLCRAKWAGWLERKYGTLEKLNHAHWSGFWSHQATTWAEVEPTDSVVDGMMVDWLRFSNDQLIDWYRHEAGVLRPITPDVPITTNFMGTMYALDYQRIAREVDVVADDQYPAYDADSPTLFQAAAFNSLKNNLYRCFNPRGGEKTFFLMESCPGAVQWKPPQKLKRPGVHRLEMLQAIAAGADGTSYFQFRAGRGGMEKLHGAVIEHTGTDLFPHTRRYKELRNLSDLYDKLTAKGPGILGTTVRPEVAILYDWESAWAQRTTNGTWVTEWHYMAVAGEQFAPYFARGIPADVLSPDRDLSKYKLVILPQLWIMTPLLAAKLRHYVEGGGTLVATWDTAMSDEHNRMHYGATPGCGLSDVFGLWVEETDRLTDGTPRAVRGAAGLPPTLAGKDVAAVVHLTTAEPLATYADDFYAGRAAVTRNRFGKGTAYYIGTRLDAVGTRAVYEMIDAPLGLTRVIDADLPDGVTAQLRGTSDAAGAEIYVFLLNFSKDPKRVPLGSRKLTDVETGASAGGEIQLEPLGSKVLRGVL